MNIKVRCWCNWHGWISFSLEVLPTDTVWSLKWKIFHEKTIRYNRKCSKRIHPSTVLLGPDNLRLTAAGGLLLKICDATLESCSVHEGSEIICYPKKTAQQEIEFMSLLDVFRKNRATELPSRGEMMHPSWFRHGSIHSHEHRFIKLKCEWRRWAKTSQLLDTIDTILHSISSVRRLDLSRSYAIGDEEIIRIAQCLEINTSLRDLRLNNCDIGTAGSLRMGRMLGVNSCLLKLHLSGNACIGNTGCIRLAEALEMNSSLKGLFLAECQIGRKGADAIARMLTKNTVLVKLCLANNAIGDEGCIRIAEGLEINASLKKLNLRRCNIGWKGAARIARMLGENGALVHLELSDNGEIGDEGCIHIAEVLKKNTTLQELHIAYCRIGSKGAVSIGMMLRQNRSLLKLFLSSNKEIRDEGCKQIVEGFMENDALQELELKCCEITRDGAASFCKMLERSKNIDARIR
eukprot:TRINITY_DN289_c0_g1_i6.p1 TRINITY_DN289_c0_g1~~TRINITY_DN289_c0_g1_i6.p1  ORF type:complete len:463 (+),score=82.80 TRINITY_DN289_c0_g1_i6:109-1497(+)